MANFRSFFSGGFPGFDTSDDSQSASHQIDNEKYYKILGVSKTATQAQIKKAYINLAKTNHPDKGGNKQKFAQINQAYQTLSDPEKRSNYDRFGPGGGMGGNQSDILNMFFGGGMGGGHSSSKRVQKVKPTKRALDVTFQNVYNGDLIKIPIKRSRCCQSCQGKGGSDVKICPDCKGKGIIVKLLQMGPGMYQQTQQPCMKCKGQGKSIQQKSKCKTCKGQKTLEKDKILEVSLQRGTPHQHVITLNGEGDELPDCLAGDVILIVNIKPHQLFTRIGADLYMKKKISLLQALTGFEFTVKHLDGTIHTITTMKNEIISDKDKKIIRGLGMPFFKDALNFGNLIIEFDVVMPGRGTLSKQQLIGLQKIIGGKINDRPKEQNYEMMQDFEIQNINSNEQGGKKDQQQQQTQGGQRVQCSSQ